MHQQTTALTLQEILRQPDTWTEAVEAVSAVGHQLTRLTADQKPALYLFTGCGTSYYLSIAAAGFFQEITGLPARAVPASELILSHETHLGAGQKALLFAFSRSGETTETVLALRRHKAEGRGPAIAVACRSTCTMGEIGDVNIALPAADDHSVVMTSSFTSMLLAAMLTAAIIRGNEGLREALSALPQVLRGQLESQRQYGEELGKELAHRQFVFLGMGPFFGLASEAMLKLKEMTQVPCESYSPLEFRHGPISIVEPGTLVVLLGSDRARRQEIDVLKDVRRLGGRTLQLGSPIGDAVDLAFAVGEGYSELVRALLYMPLLQTTAYYRAMMLGRDPDRPQHLTQVVTLDERALSRGEHD